MDVWIFLGEVKNCTFHSPINKNNLKLRNLFIYGKVEHFYGLHYPNYEFHEVAMFIGDMRFMKKYPESPPAMVLISIIVE